MAAWRTNRKRLVLTLTSALVVGCFLWGVLFDTFKTIDFTSLPSGSWETDSTDWTYDPSRDANDLGLDAHRCEVAFPGLYQEIDRAKEWHHKHRRHGKIYEHQIDQYDERAPLMRLLIYNGQLRVLDTYGIEGPFITDRPLATILAIHRAISSVPHPKYLPNIEFTIDTQDNAKDGGPKGTIWSYCRHRSSNATWVMPDFGFWSYPGIGSYAQFRSNVQNTEERKGFAAKKKQLVWRGAEVNGGEVRRALVRACKGKRWCDASFLKWEDPKTSLDMHEHCRYQFAAHTEGATWSGRLRYLQNCGNVVVTHKLEYMAPYYPLMVTSGPDQNIVEVSRNFTELGTEMTDLLSDHTKAEQIARNGAEMFRDRYLTPAAEACYWRRMITAWREVQGFEPRLWTDGRKGEEGKRRWRGVAWEQYAVTGKHFGEDAPH